VPVRPWASNYLPPWLPLPGDGTAEWQGYHNYGELPQLTNPPEDYIATANNDMTGALWDGDPTNNGEPYWQSLVDPGYREERIKVRLDRRRAQPRPGPDAGHPVGHPTRGGRGRAPPDHGRSPTPRAAWSKPPAKRSARPSPPGTLTLPHRPPRRHRRRRGRIRTRTSPAASAGCAAFHAVFYRLNDWVFRDELAAYNFSNEHAREETLIALLTRP
jgi:hypothetical protein